MTIANVKYEITNNVPRGAKYRSAYLKTALTRDQLLEAMWEAGFTAWPPTANGTNKDSTKEEGAAVSVLDKIRFRRSELFYHPDVQCDRCVSAGIPCTTHLAGEIPQLNKRGLLFFPPCTGCTDHCNSGEHGSSNNQGKKKGNTKCSQQTCRANEAALYLVTGDVKHGGPHGPVVQLREEGKVGWVLAKTREVYFEKADQMLFRPSKDDDDKKSASPKKAAATMKSLNDMLAPDYSATLSNGGQRSDCCDGDCYDIEFSKMEVATPNDPDYNEIIATYREHFGASPLDYGQRLGRMVPLFETHVAGEDLHGDQFPGGIIRMLLEISSQVIINKQVPYKTDATGKAASKKPMRARYGRK